MSWDTPSTWLHPHLTPAKLRRWTNTGRVYALFPACDNAASCNTTALSQEQSNVATAGHWCMAPAFKQLIALSATDTPTHSGTDETTQSGSEAKRIHMPRIVVFNMWVSTPLGVTYQIFTWRFITVAQLQLWSSCKIILGLGVTMLWGTVLKGCSIRKFVNHW